MLEEQGKVLEVLGDYARVTAQPTSACGSCSAKKGCGTSLLSELFSRRSRIFMAHNLVGAKAGDAVTIGLDESVMQRASVMVYLLPLLTLLGGAMLGQWLAPADMPADLFSIGGGIVGLFFPLYLIKKYSAQIFSGGRFQVRIIRVNSPETTLLKLQK